MLQSTSNRIIHSFEKIISFLERERLNFVAIFLWVLFLGAIRMWTEAKIFGYPYRKLDYYFIFFHLHIISFYICVFLGGIFILKFLTRERIRKIANLTSWGFLFVTLPPIIDHFVFHYKTYTYVPKEKFLYFILFSYHKIFPEIAGYGLFIEIILILIFTTLYIYIKTHSLTKSIINFVSFNFFIAFISTPTLNPLLRKWETGDLCQPVFFFRYIILSLLLFALILLISKKGLLSSFFISSGPLRMCHFLLMGAIGIFIAGHIKLQHEFTSYFNAGNIGVMGIALFTILFLWEYASMINNVYDVEIDKVTKKRRVLVQGFLNPTQLREISVILAISAVGLAITLGWIQIILTIFFIFLATIYSVPPVRLRNSIFSTTIIGLGSTLAFLIGYFAPSYTILGDEIIRSYPPLTNFAIIIGWIIFISLSVGSMVKDIDDYEGDKKSGIRNVFTVYGKEKGLCISSILLLPVFLSPLLLFHEYFDFFVFTPVSILTAYIFYKIHKSWVTFPFYFIILFYCLLRWFQT